MGKKPKSRCTWCPEDDSLYVAYHDKEWAVPVYDDTKLFEFIILESAQAGLSWRTILHRREGYRKAFKNFDYKKVAKMTDRDVEKLMKDEGIIRNRAKILASIKNAKAFLAVQKEFGSFSNYMWSFSKGKVIKNAWKKGSEVPETTELAITMSKDLKKRGFGFLGPRIWYAHMQAVGMVNDHTKECFKYTQV